MNNFIFIMNKDADGHAAQALMNEATETGLFPPTDYTGYGLMEIDYMGDIKTTLFEGEVKKLKAAILESTFRALLLFTYFPEKNKKTYQPPEVAGEPLSSNYLGIGRIYPTDRARTRKFLEVMGVSTPVDAWVEPFVGDFALYSEDTTKALFTDDGDFEFAILQTTDFYNHEPRLENIYFGSNGSMMEIKKSKKFIICSLVHARTHKLENGGLGGKIVNLDYGSETLELSSIELPNRVKGGQKIPFKGGEKEEEEKHKDYPEDYWSRSYVQNKILEDKRETFLVKLK